jgi:hypothetical protein
MPDVLEQRLEALRRGIAEVGQLSKVLAENSERVRALSRAARRASERVMVLVQRAGYVAGLLAAAVDVSTESHDDPSEITDRLVLALKETVRPAADLKEDLEQLAKDLLSSATSARNAQQQVVTFDQDLAIQVTKVAEVLGGALDEAGRTARRGDSMKAWGDICDTVVPAAHRLLAQYVDLLGGISIRERGISMTGQRVDDLCDISHALASGELSACMSSGGRIALMVPARDAALRFADLPVLSLGVGQWSLWGLPLVAHDFGRLALATKIDTWMTDPTRCPEKVRRAFGDDGGLVTLAADVFAAWALGPAYVAALLYLELDPRVGSVVDGELRDADRAAILRASLADDRRGARLGYDFDAAVVKPLFDRWRCAQKEAGTPGLDEEREQLLQEIARSLPDELQLVRPFSMEDWRLARTIAETSDPSAAENHVKQPEVGLRHVLNAAWWTRLRLGHDVTAAEQRAGELANIRIIASTGKALRAGTAKASTLPQRPGGG